MASTHRQFRALRGIWPCIYRGQNYVQASDFMNDEKGVQGLCRQAARWLFESSGSVLPTPDQTSDNEGSQEFCPPSEDKIKM